MPANIENTSIKSTKWTITFFYALIVFEFIYMASPLAVYFYSVYSPGLNFFNMIPGAAWLTGFFLPHIVEDTSSGLINLHNMVGVIFVSAGFITFLVGAIQVYYNKLFKKGAVVGGIYRYIRHPQYTSFAICSFGMLLLWPRYLVLIMFVSVLFVYYFLAKYEEKECEQKFGAAYMEYKRKTNMFLPFKIFSNNKPLTLPGSKLQRWGAVAVIYLLSIGFSLALAHVIHKLSIDSLYAQYTDNSVYISVTEVDHKTFDKIIAAALSNDEVRQIINQGEQSNKARFINYILPAQMYVSEIPMSSINIIEQNHFLHNSKPTNGTTYKIIFTKSVLSTDKDVKGKDILFYTFITNPVFEVWIDITKNEVINLIPLQKEKRYGDTPVPVY